MSRARPIDYGALLADDFLKWSESWTWTWKPQTHAKGPVNSPPKARVISGVHSSSGPQTPPPSAQKAYLSSISDLQSPISQLPSPSSNSPSTSNSASTSVSTSFPPSQPQKEGPLFTTEYFEVRPSVKGGYGAFAIQDIPKGTVVIMEKALFAGTTGEVFYMYELLSKEQRREYMGLHAYWESQGNRVLSIFKTNRFEVTYSVCAIFLKSSRFNHACHPYSTCTYEVDKKNHILKVTALFDISKGQELTISYTNIPSDLPHHYGFYCDCPNCPPPEVAAAKAKMLMGPSAMASVPMW